MQRDDEWAAHSGSWDDEPSVRAYAEAAYSSLQVVLDQHDLPLHGAHVCDFGCGTGLMTERLLAGGATVDAIDSSPAMLAVLRDKVETRRLLGVRALSELPPASSPDYDVIVCSSVCSFLDDYPSTVGELAERLRPGGVFVQWDWERSIEDAGGHGLTRGEVDAALATAGLANVAVTTGFEITFDDQHMRPLVGHGRRPPPG